MYERVIEKLFVQTGLEGFSLDYRRLFYGNRERLEYFEGMEFLISGFFFHKTLTNEREKQYLISDIYFIILRIIIAIVFVMVDKF